MFVELDHGQTTLLLQSSQIRNLPHDHIGLPAMFSPSHDCGLAKGWYAKYMLAASVAVVIGSLETAQWKVTRLFTNRASPKLTAPRHFR
jgi:hypothetical protein